MAVPEFYYQERFPLGEEETEYYLLTRDFVSLSQFEGKDILRVDPQGLELLARTAMHDTSFMLRTGHVRQLAAILNDPEASKNDKFVALVLLRNAEIAAKGILPLCQDTGTA
ncbi:MAG TPA: fumarate hydratase, partial [Tenuifilaceae bacterium]|nr:fumarate hydratase [Tenuifilaceae bacterium]